MKGNEHLLRFNNREITHCSSGFGKYSFGKGSVAIPSPQKEITPVNKLTQEDDSLQPISARKDRIQELKIINYDEGRKRSLSIIRNRYRK